MPDPMPGKLLPDGELPDALARDIASLYRSDVSVPPALDAAILAEARAGVARRLRFRRALRWTTAGAGAAAAAAVVWGVSLVGFHKGGNGSPQPSNADAVAIKGDVDRNGRVDIVDAFVVAKRVDSA